MMRYVGLLVEFVAFQCKTNLDFDDPDYSNLEMAQDILHQFQIGESLFLCWFHYC